MHTRMLYIEIDNCWYWQPFRVQHALQHSHTKSTFSHYEIFALNWWTLTHWLYRIVHRISIIYTTHMRNCFGICYLCVHPHSALFMLIQLDCIIVLYGRQLEGALSALFVTTNGQMGDGYCDQLKLFVIFFLHWTSGHRSLSPNRQQVCVRPPFPLIYVRAACNLIHLFFFFLELSVVRRSNWITRN